MGMKGPVGWRQAAGAAGLFQYPKVGSMGMKAYSRSKPARCMRRFQYPKVGSMGMKV